MPMLAGTGRGSRQARWARRIAGLLGTGALLAVAVAILVMIVPGGDTAPDETAAVAPTATPTPTAAKKAPQTERLTAAQKRARTAAVQAMSTQGYVPVSLRDYDPGHELRVLVGRPSSDAGGARRAFFFAGGEYVGSDSTEPSTGLKVSGSGDDWVTLRYGLYATGDRACCPSGGHAKVRYEWSGSAVTPVGGTIPASYQRVLSG
jgi:hypothetical protein